MDEWTVSTLKIHTEELRRAQEKFEAERDLRYAQLAREREKHDAMRRDYELRALELARQIQTYKDEKANELRSQIESERGLYTTQAQTSSSISGVYAEIRSGLDKMHETMKPLIAYYNAQQGSKAITGRDMAAWIMLGLGVVGGLVGLISFLQRQ